MCGQAAGTPGRRISVRSRQAGAWRNRAGRQAGLSKNSPALLHLEKRTLQYTCSDWLCIYCPFVCLFPKLCLVCDTPHATFYSLPIVLPHLVIIPIPQLITPTPFYSCILDLLFPICQLTSPLLNLVLYPYSHCAKPSHPQPCALITVCGAPCLCDLWFGGAMLFPIVTITIVWHCVYRPRLTL